MCCSRYRCPQAQQRDVGVRYRGRHQAPLRRAVAAAMGLFCPLWMMEGPHRLRVQRRIRCDGQTRLFAGMTLADTLCQAVSGRQVVKLVNFRTFAPYARVRPRAYTVEKQGTSPTSPRGWRRRARRVRNSQPLRILNSADCIACPRAPANASWHEMACCLPRVSCGRVAAVGAAW